MSATSANSRSASSASRRLPLTPSVVSNRRGGHATSRPARTRTPEAAPAPATPALHISPNVVSAARGDLKLDIGNQLSAAYSTRALDMRGLRH